MGAALLLAAAAAASAAELPPVPRLLAEASRRAARQASAPGAPLGGSGARHPDAALEERVVLLLKEILRIRPVVLSCGDAPLCVLDRIYYEKAAVDLRVAWALEGVPSLLREGRPDRAAALILDVEGARVYEDGLAPSGAPLYPAGGVRAKVEEALRLLLPRR